MHTGTDVYELGALPLTKPVMLANAVGLVSPNGTEVISWCHQHGIDLMRAAEAAVAAGAVRAATGLVPAKGVRTFVNEETFPAEFLAYLTDVQTGARSRPNHRRRPSVRHLVRTALTTALGSRRVLGVVQRLCSRPEDFERVARRSPFAAWQQPGEIVSLLQLLEGRRPRWILEVGTARGGTLYLFAKVASPDARLVTIDLEHPKRPDLLRSFARGEQDIQLVVGDSAAPETAEKARALLPQGIDFLFLDGNHTYEAVRKDFETYSPLVRPGGVIAFHDVVEDNITRFGIATGGFSGEVPRFWREVKERFTHKEFIADPRQDGFGIGVILLPAAN